MQNLTLNPEQIQASLYHLIEQPNGINQVLEMALNSLMKAERSAYLNTASESKDNGFRPINGMGI
jgi:putative transposase